MSLTATFSGSSSPANTISPQGSAGNYYGGSPDFTAVVAAVDTGTYKLSVINYGGVSGWPQTFKMTKSDTAPGNVIGSYTEDGGSGTATIA